jgi:hypothetical protein
MLPTAMVLTTVCVAVSIIDTVFRSGSSRTRAGRRMSPPPVRPASHGDGADDGVCGRVVTETVLTPGSSRTRAGRRASPPPLKIGFHAS